MPDPPKEPEATQDEGPKGRFPPPSTSAVWQNNNPRVNVHWSNLAKIHAELYSVYTLLSSSVALLDLSLHTILQVYRSHKDAACKMATAGEWNNSVTFVTILEDEMNTQLKLYTWHFWPQGGRMRWLRAMGSVTEGTASLHPWLWSRSLLFVFDRVVITLLFPLHSERGH